MTFILKLSFRNLNHCFLQVIIILLLAPTVTKGKRLWMREIECETTTNVNIKDDDEHKENSEIASLIAQKAAQEAKEASDAQNQAGAEAALEVKEELAQRAEDAARAAQAALAGKQAVVDELERQIKEDEYMIREQTEAQQRISDAAKSADNAAKQMDSLARELQQAIQMAQAASQSSKSVAADIQKESDAKTKLIEQARVRLSKLIDDLKQARNDLDHTMEAAKKAVNSAKSAETNANRQKRVIRQRFRRKNSKFK